MPNNGSTTYSFKDTTGALASPLAPPIIIAGGKTGLNQIVVRNATTRSTQQLANDGAVMTSYRSGSNGGFDLEVQQTSAIHKALLALFNLHQTAADADDVSAWAQITLAIQNNTDGSGHQLTGCSFTKIPDKTYSGDGGMLTWTFLASEVVSV